MHLNSLNVIQIFEARAKFDAVIINRVKHKALSKYSSRASDCLIQGLEMLTEMGSSPSNSSAVILTGNRSFFPKPKIKMQNSIVLTSVFKDML